MLCRCLRVINTIKTDATLRSACAVYDSDPKDFLLFILKYTFNICFYGNTPLAPFPMAYKWPGWGQILYLILRIISFIPFYLDQCEDSHAEIVSKPELFEMLKYAACPLIVWGIVLSGR